MKLTLHGLCFPANALAFLVCGVLWLLSPGRVWTSEGALFLAKNPTGWLADRGKYSMTWGHTIWWHPGHTPEVAQHELVHVRQFEAHCVASWLAIAVWAVTLALTGSHLAGFGVVVVLWWGIAYVGACIAAFLAGRHAYRGNSYEQHARAEVYIGGPV